MYCSSEKLLDQVTSLVSVYNGKAFQSTADPNTMLLEHFLCLLAMMVFR